MTFFSQIFIFQAFCPLISPNQVLAHQLGLKSIFKIVSIKTIYTTECFKSSIARFARKFLSKFLLQFSSCLSAQQLQYGQPAWETTQKLSSKHCDQAIDTLCRINYDNNISAQLSSLWHLHYFDEGSQTRFLPKTSKRLHATLTNNMQE